MLFFVVVGGGVVGGVVDGVVVGVVVVEGIVDRMVVSFVVIDPKLNGVRRKLIFKKTYLITTNNSVQARFHTCIEFQTNWAGIFYIFNKWCI